MLSKEAMKVLGVSYSTLQRYVKRGLINVYKYQMPGKMGKNNYWDDDVYALVGNRIKKDHLIVGYCRVRNRFKEDMSQLQSQKNLMREFCTRRGISLERIYEDIGASTDYSKKGRPGFHTLLQDVMQGKIQAVVVDTKCRITRVAFEIYTEVLSYYGTEVIIMNPVLEDPYYLSEQAEDLTYLVKKAGLDRIKSSEPK